MRSPFTARVGEAPQNVSAVVSMTSSKVLVLFRECVQSMRSSPNVRAALLDLRPRSGCVSGRPVSLDRSGLYSFESPLRSEVPLPADCTSLKQQRDCGFTC